MSFKNSVIYANIICFVLMFDIGIVFIINKCDSQLYQNEYNSAQREFFDVSQNINYIMNNVGYDDKNEIIGAVSGYLTLCSSSDKIFSVSDTKKEIDTKNSILFSQPLPQPCQNYALIYQHDLSGLKNTVDDMKKTAILASVIMILAAFLFDSLILNILFKPFDKVLAGIKAIRQGDYDTNIPIKSKGEFRLISDELNNMTAKIKSNIEQLKKNAEEKELFAENMAHELRNPLTSIKGFGEYLANPEISENDRRTSLEYINSETARLLKMCRKILEMSLNADSLMIEKINTKSMAEDIQKSTYFYLKNKNITLTEKYDTEYFYADKALITSVIVNLIENAVNASQNDTEIKFGISKEKDITVISISDEGCGMPQDEINKIFQPFYRVDKARSRKNGGSGLGINIVKKAVELHNGKLEISSVLNIGTEIKVFLPNNREMKL